MKTELTAIGNVTSMTGVRPALLMSVVLAAMALGLTLDQLLRPQPTYFSWPNGAELGALVLLALIGTIGWLVRDTRTRSRANFWAKSAFALAISVPLAWLAVTEIVRWKLVGLPDDDMPEGLVERMIADVVQMHVSALVVTTGVLFCLVMTTRTTRRDDPSHNRANVKGS